VELTDENRQAYDLFGKIKALGSEMVFGLIDIQMHVVDAENLLERLVLIENMVAEIQNQNRKEA